MKKIARKYGFWLFLSVLVIAMATSIFLAPGRANWGLVTLVLVMVILAAFYSRWEKGGASAREVALTAALGAVAAAGRVIFAALPQVQPTTFLVVAAGSVFGGRTGFLTGATAALVSNFFLGQGPWTPWQMFCWGLAGYSAALAAPVLERGGRPAVLAFLVGWGYLFGWIMNLWYWAAFVSPLSWETFLLVYAASFGLDTCHAAGNAAFYLLGGSSVEKIFQRFAGRLSFEYLEYLPAKDIDS